VLTIKSFFRITGKVLILSIIPPTPVRTYSLSGTSSSVVLSIQDHNVVLNSSFSSDVANTDRSRAGRKCVYNILDTNRELVSGYIRTPQVRVERSLRRLERMLINDAGKGWGWEVSLRLQRMQRPLAVKPRR
jgi:hypothetical protein